MFDRKTYARSLSNATRNQRHNGITRARTSPARLRCSASRYDYLEPENIFSHIKGGTRLKDFCSCLQRFALARYTRMF